MNNLSSKEKATVMNAMDQEEASKIRDRMLDENFRSLVAMLYDAKPDERSERARAFAICITEVEKAYAYFLAFVHR